MYRNLNHLVTFAALAAAGSFAGAARRLGLPPSTVSEHIAALEKNLGVPLVVRTTRKSQLTAAGRRLAANAERMVLIVEEAMAALDAERGRPEGKLKISVPFAFAADLIGPAVGQFSQRYPGIQLEFVLSNEVQDLIGGGFDLAIRVGKLSDSSLIRRKLGTQPQFLVAARSYIDAEGAPSHLDDLTDHCVVGYVPRQSLTFHGPEGQVERTFECRVSANDPKTLAAIVRGGGGIAMLPRFLVQDGLADGTLEVLLPTYRPGSVDLSIVRHGSPVSNPRADLFARFVQEALGVWD